MRETWRDVEDHGHFAQVDQIQTSQRHLGFDVLFEQHPRVAEWSERVAKMPSVVVEGVERWFNPKYLALFAEKRPEVIARISRLAG